jgi:hypothetical protein
MWLFQLQRNPRWQLLDRPIKESQSTNTTNIGTNFTLTLKNPTVSGLSVCIEGELEYEVPIPALICFIVALSTTKESKMAAT